MQATIPEMEKIEPRIALKQSMAAHLAQDSAEIRTILALFQSRSASHKRLTDAILTDEGFRPEEFDSYHLRTEGSEVFLIPVRNGNSG